LREEFWLKFYTYFVTETLLDNYCSQL